MTDPSTNTADTTNQSSNSGTAPPHPDTSPDATATTDKRPEDKKTVKTEDQKKKEDKKGEEDKDTKSQSDQSDYPNHGLLVINNHEPTSYWQGETVELSQEEVTTITTAPAHQALITAIGEDNGELYESLLATVNDPTNIAINDLGTALSYRLYELRLRARRVNQVHQITRIEAMEDQAIVINLKDSCDQLQERLQEAENEIARLISLGPRPLDTKTAADQTPPPKTKKVSSEDQEKEKRDRDKSSSIITELSLATVDGGLQSTLDPG